MKEDKELKTIKRNLTSKNGKKQNRKSKRPKAAMLCSSSESEDESNFDQDEDSVESLSQYVERESKEQREEIMAFKATIEQGDYVLVKLYTKRKVVFYVGKVEKLLENDSHGDYAEFNFLRAIKDGKNMFRAPDVPDIHSIDFESIISVLPAPKLIGNTQRLKNCNQFDVSFDSFEMRQTK